MSVSKVIYECIGCKRLHATLEQACECQKNPEGLYREFVATPKQVPVPQCSSCGGSDAPCDQVDCPTIPCKIGRPNTRYADLVTGQIAE